MKNGKEYVISIISFIVTQIVNDIQFNWHFKFSRLKVQKHNFPINFTRLTKYIKLSRWCQGWHLNWYKIQRLLLAKFCSSTFYQKINNIIHNWTFCYYRMCFLIFDYPFSPCPFSLFRIRVIPKDAKEKRVLQEHRVVLELMVLRVPMAPVVRKERKVTPLLAWMEILENKGIKESKEPMVETVMKRLLKGLIAVRTTQYTQTTSF